MSTRAKLGHSGLGWGSGLQAGPLAGCSQFDGVRQSDQAGECL